MHKFIIVSLVTALFSSSSHAEIIQILHTNDLHGSILSTGAPVEGTQELGGWAQIKAKMNLLAEEAASISVQTIRLDAGDFYEGSVYSFPERGIPLMRAYSSFNWNAAAIGNHDWLTGARPLSELFREFQFPFKILGANFIVHRSLRSLDHAIFPTHEFNIGSTKVGIIGLTTTEAFYKWATDIDSRKRDAKFAAINETARKYIRRLRNENDLLLALTHLGTKTDKKLAEKTKNLDLIVGGHSHSTLFEHEHAYDKTGHQVPIVQAGSNGRYIGQLLIDVPSHATHANSKSVIRPKVVSYKLVPVCNDGPQDEEMAKLVQENLAALDRAYGKPYLEEVIGKSEVRLVNGANGPSAFSQFSAEAMRAAVDAEIAFDIGAFHGGTAQPAGPVTRKNLMDIYPRRFEYDRMMGTNVYTSYIPGWALRLAVRVGADYGLYISSPGLTYDVIPTSELPKFKYAFEKEQYSRYFAYNLEVNGEPLKLFRYYKTSLPEAFVRGALGITPLTKIIITKPTDSRIPIWDALERHLKKIGTIRALQPGKIWGILNDSQIMEKGTYAKVPWHLEDREFSGYLERLFNLNTIENARKRACDEEHSYKDCPAE